MLPRVLFALPVIAAVSLTAAFLGMNGIAGEAADLTPTVSPTPAPGSPADVVLAASPAAMVCDGVTSSTVTATITDAFGNNVADGTPVNFSVVALGTTNPINTVTVDGVASSTVTPLAAASGVTVIVTSGDAQASIRVDCIATGTPTPSPTATPTPRPGGPERVQLAFVTFEQSDTSGCVVTSFNAIGRHAEIRPHSEATGMLVTYSIYDVCADGPIEFFQEIIDLPTDAFSMHQNRRSAQLNAEVSVEVDIGPAAGTMRDVVIALTWTSDARAQKNMSPAGTERSRVADVQGTVTIDGVPVVSGLAFERAALLWTVP